MSMKVLLIEDDPAYVRVLERRLKTSQKQPIEVTCADRLENACHLIEKQMFDAALVNLNLPDSKGLNTFRTIVEIAPQLPIILLTGNADESLALQVVKEGAEDYIVKGEVPEQYLGRAITYAIERKALKVSLQQTNRQLENLIRTDVLTGLLSRRYGLSCLDEEIARYHRYGTPVSVLHLDVDEFKQVNDCYGHEAGDNALRSVATYLEASKRTVDKAIRYGGDEFLIILPESDLSAAEAVCQRMSAQPIPCQLRADISKRLTLSIGAACAVKMKTSTDVIDAADLAMLIAKRRGKGQYYIYREEMTPTNRKAALRQLERTRASIRNVFCRTLDMALAEIEREGDLIESRHELMLELGKGLARRLNLSPDDWETLSNAIYLTMFEKLTLCWEIASQATELTARQHQVFKQTVQRNIALLQSTRFLSYEADVLGAMYEWYDGTGLYGLQREQIPLLSRALGLLWAYALLCIGGPHTPPHGHEHAWQCICDEAGTHFDPELVARLAPVVEDYYADSHHNASGEILLVDAQASLSALLAQRLSHVGYHVAVVNTLASARERLLHTPWFAILIDTDLPDGNGLDLLIDITAKTAQSPLPAIIISSEFEQAAIERAEQQGARAYFVKPVRLEKLLKTLAMFRDDSGSAAFQVVSSVRYET